MSDPESALASKIKGEDTASMPPFVFRQGEVTAVNVGPPPTLSLKIGGSDEVVPDAAYGPGYYPMTGDTVWIFHSGTDVLVYGAKADGFEHGVKPGTMMLWPGDPGTKPIGWEIADGGTLSRTTHQNRLFAVIGTKYGAGDGSTTFNKPNWQGRFPIGAGTLGSDSYAVGVTGGEARHTLTRAELPSGQTGGGGGHGHGNTGSGPASSQGVNVTPGSGDTAARGGSHTHGTDNVGDHSHSIGGGDDPHENRPPYRAAYVLIST